MIIDIHTHLGDILYPGGGALIEKKGVKKGRIFDPITFGGWLLYRTLPGTSPEAKQRITLSAFIVKCERSRNLTATVENMRRSMDRAGVTQNACMPIPPHVTFDDLERARRMDPGVIPFTGVDYTTDHDIQAVLRDHVSRGAKGMKLHPIIQNTPLTSERTFEAVEAFALHNLPVLFHSGVASYYLGEEAVQRQNPSYGEIRYAADLVRAFPTVPFIAAHAGVVQIHDVMELLGPFRNARVDISFQSSENIRELLRVFGPDRVLYASDWPWGDRLPNIRTVKKACRGDKALERRIFYENAAELMRLL